MPNGQGEQCLVNHTQPGRHGGSFGWDDLLPCGVTFCHREPLLQLDAMDGVLVESISRLPSCLGSPRPESQLTRVQILKLPTGVSCLGLGGNEAAHQTIVTTGRGSDPIIHW